jgi:hypothetical protein
LLGAENGFPIFENQYAYRTCAAFAPASTIKFAVLPQKHQGQELTFGNLHRHKHRNKD